MGGRPSPPRIDYAAIARQQEQERQRLQAIRDEQFRVEGIGDYINYMYDNPSSERMRSATGQYFTATSPGRVPNQLLDTYRDDKSITLKDIKADQGKFFAKRTAVPSLKEGRIRMGKRADKPIDTGGLLGASDQDKKRLLGA
jgi:hypothetical protein